MPRRNSKPFKPTDKPSKPDPEFPLHAHRNGTWARRILGKVLYFGPWADPAAALANYVAEQDALHAGQSPRPDPAAFMVRELCNAFLNAKRLRVDSGELTERS